MDTSKTYIKMCDCPEIRKAYWDLIDRDGKRRRARYDDFYSTRKSSDWILGVPDITSPDVTILNKDGKTARRINLPTQDQIQEMMADNEGCSLTAIAEFSRWIAYNADNPKPHYNDAFDTGEQLWLAFYMHRNHSLSWDGEKWIKEKK